MFLSQTYINKEMIIIYYSEDYETKNYLLNLNNVLIKAIEYNNDLGLNIGDKRNFGLQYCSGYYVMVWDDDDLYHKDRIRVYVEHIGNNDAICSNELVMFDIDTNNIYMNHFKYNGWENTLMFKNIPDLKYANFPNFEDTFLLEKLNEKYKIVIMDLTEYQIYVRWKQNNFNLVTKILLFNEISNEMKNKIFPIISEFYDRELYIT